ncbi:hypothetical protein MMC07_001077 [Pseudocyphellaria aurata]|nr:hypothetical protein [Pseudocyphellaria aurata]
MPSSIKNVIIVGAGGKLGPNLLSAFDADPSFIVSVLARQSSKSTFPSHIKVHRVGDAYLQAELLEALKGQDAVISTIGSAHAIQQNAIIDAAIQAGVKRFVPSEFSSDTHNSNAVAILPEYFKGKLETVDYLKGKEKEGLTWTAFVTGPFFEWATQSGFLGFNLKEHKATILNHGNDRWSTSTFSAVGSAVKNAMLIPEKTANKYLYVGSFTISQNELLASFEKATGAQWEVTHLDAEIEKEIAVEKKSQGDYGGFVSLQRYIICVDGHGGNFLDYRENARELLSLPKQNLDEVVEGILKD